MKNFGLIGFPLTHSFSPTYFNEKFVAEALECTYESYPLDSIGKLSSLVNKMPSLCGLNVTIPYKSSVIPYLDFISQDADKINAVNCIKIENGKMYGFNTDHFGFSESLFPLLNKKITKALVLGTGGSSKGICYALDGLGIAYKLVSSTQSGDFSYQELTQDILEDYLLIINTTPLGMFPNVSDYPAIPYSFVTKEHLLFDLIYNPEETIFLQKGKQNNARTKNGMEMLILQAEKSWEIWSHKLQSQQFIPIQ